MKNVKPHPEGIEFILKKIGALSSEAMIIGDCEVDIIAGKNAGIRTAGVTWGLTEDERDLSKHKPDIIFRNPEELLGI